MLAVLLQAGQSAAQSTDPAAPSLDAVEIVSRLIALGGGLGLLLLAVHAVFPIIVIFQLWLLGRRQRQAVEELRDLHGQVRALEAGAYKLGHQVKEATKRQ